MKAIGASRLGRLFDEHAAALVLFARQWSSDPDDVVQEAFLRLARQPNAPENPAAWLFEVVRNVSISDARGNRRRRDREARAADRAPWFTTRVDDALDAREAARLLDELNPAHREVVVARIWGGLTFDEIARLAGCSVSAAHRRYEAGLSRLHERLEPTWTPNLTPNRS